MVASSSALALALVAAPSPGAASPPTPGAQASVTSSRPTTRSSSAASSNNAAPSSSAAASPATLAPSAAASSQSPTPPPAPAPPTIAPPPAAPNPAAGYGLTPLASGAPGPVYLWERTFFDVFVLRREDFLRWQPVRHLQKGWIVDLRPTTITTLEVTKGPLKHLALTTTAIHGATLSPPSIAGQVGIKVPGTTMTIFGQGLWSAIGAARGRSFGLAGRF